MNAKLKAYEVSGGCEGYGTIVFATNSATARREGANELGIEWEDVNTCKRVQGLDSYAPGPVPVLVLINEFGWWFECQHCGRRVSDEMAEEIEDDGLDPADFVIRTTKDMKGVYCSASCECADHMERSGCEEAEEALREVFEAKFPGAKIVRIHCYDGPKLVAGERGKYVVTFTFPGSAYTSTWNFGDEKCFVPQIDVDAFKAWHQKMIDE